MLFLCFIDLLNAYDPVDCTLLWQLLACSGVAPQMIQVVCQFHNETRACERNDGDVCSKWFEVAQELFL